MHWGKTLVIGIDRRGALGGERGGGNRGGGGQRWVKGGNGVSEAGKDIRKRVRGVAEGVLI